MKNRPRELAMQCIRTSVVAASLITLSLPAAAQDDAEPSPSDAPTTEDAPSLAEREPPAATFADETAATKTEPRAPPEPEAEVSPKTPEKASAAELEANASSSAHLSAKSLGPDASAEASGDPGDVPSAPAEPPPLALELLPPSAYPNVPATGIPGGSLSLMINRMQYPYMPKYEGPPALRVGLSGYAWFDANYRAVEVGQENEPDQTEYKPQGRFNLRVTPVYNHEDDWFLQTNIEFIANADQDHSPWNYVDIDDAWIRVGKWKLFDIQVGRMQGFEVYHFGMGLDQNTYERSGAGGSQSTLVLPYGLTDLWDRGLTTGGAAVHWYYPEWLRLEFLTRFGVSGASNDIGLRPVGVLDLGWVKLKGGYERRVRRALEVDVDTRTQTQGVGASLQFVFNPWVELGGSVGHRTEDSFEVSGEPALARCHTTFTYGGFLNARPYFEDWLVGVGYHRTYWENFNHDAFGEPENDTHRQMFGAVQYLLWDKLYIKYVLGYAIGHKEARNDTDPSDAGYENKVMSHRLRLMMLY